MYVRPISTRLLSGMLIPAMRAKASYPCRCLCRGFWQMTSTRPFRRMILHFSHIGLTDGRTFMIPFEACGFDEPDGEALETGAVAATIPRSGLLHADGPLDLSATGEYSAVFRASRQPRGGCDGGWNRPAHDDSGRHGGAGARVGAARGGAWVLQPRDPRSHRLSQL